VDPADLLDYALGRLDGPRRERLERMLAGDPELAERVARLVRNVGRLLDDGRERRPPKGAPSPRSSSSLPTPHDTVERPPPDSH
jgi:anti-sigma factor RsiW